jgi:hypothetical protein
MIRNHLQYAEIILHNGTHKFNYFTFISCAPHGITKTDVLAHLNDYHNVELDSTSEDLPKGMFWVDNNESSAGVYPRNRDDKNSNKLPVYDVNSEYIQNIKKYAPELIA